MGGLSLSAVWPTCSTSVRAQCEFVPPDPAAELAVKERYVLWDGIAADV
jgi:hypothetical protein